MATTSATKWFIALFIGVLVATTVVMLIPTDEPETKPLSPEPVPSISASNSPDFAPSAVAVIDPQSWTPVVDLPTIEGDWEVRKGRDFAGAKLRIKKGGKGSLYPYSLRFEPGVDDKKPLDCGFYTKTKEEWRLAYCSGFTLKPVAGSSPHRVTFHVAHGRNDRLRLQVGNMLELYLERSK